MHDDTVACLKTSYRNYNLTTHLRRAAIGRATKVTPLGISKTACVPLRPCDELFWTLKVLPARDDRAWSRKMDTQVLGKVRLGHNELVEKRGLAGCGRRYNIPGCWVDERVRDRVIQRVSVHIRPERRWSRDR
jgi:hypothetical protein